MAALAAGGVADAAAVDAVEAARTSTAAKGRTHNDGAGERPHQPTPHIGVKGRAPYQHKG